MLCLRYNFDGQETGAVNPEIKTAILSGRSMNNVVW